MYTTVWSLNNKHRELELLIYEYNFDLVGITETSCEELHDWNIKISWYNFLNMDRVDRVNKEWQPILQEKKKRKKSFYWLVPSNQSFYPAVEEKLKVVYKSLADGIEIHCF